MARLDKKKIGFPRGISPDPRCAPHSEWFCHPPCRYLCNPLAKTENRMASTGVRSWNP